MAGRRWRVALCELGRIAPPESFRRQRHLRCRTQPFDRSGRQDRAAGQPADRNGGGVRYGKRNVINPNAIDPFVKSQIGKPLSNVPRHNASLFALKTLGRVGIGGGVTHVGRRAGDPFGTPYRLPAYTIARAVVRYALTDRVTARADVDNLFDTYYISSSYSNVWTVPGAPRNVRLTVRAGF